MTDNNVRTFNLQTGVTMTNAIDTREDEVADFLMPGHVWTHNKKGTKATVMFVTNTHLADKYLETYPRQVVYIDASGNLTTNTVAQFVKNRSFFQVDPTVEDAIQHLVDSLDEEDEKLDLASEDQQDEKQGETSLGSAGYGELAADPTPISLSLSVSTQAALPVVPQQLLADAIRGYEATPQANEDVLHSVTFELSDELDNEKLYTAFSSPIVRYSAAVIQGIPVEWDSFLGIYPKVTEDKKILGVATFLERGQAAEEQEEKTAAKTTKPAAKTPAKPAAKTTKTATKAAAAPAAPAATDPGASTAAPAGGGTGSTETPAA